MTTTQRVDTLHPIVTALFARASDEDAVRIVSQENGYIQSFSACFYRPGWDGVEKQYHPSDFAMCEAIGSMDLSWEMGLPLNRMVDLIDNPPECDYGCP